MASFKQYTASGGASEAFSIPTFASDEIKVRVDGVLKTAGTHYNITSYTANGGTVTWTSGNVPSSGTVYIYRDTKILNSGNSDVEGKATYSNGTAIYHNDLNDNQKQVLRAIEEENDQLIQSWDLASGVVETDSIKDGTIVDADVNASANIAGSKLADDSVTLAKLGSGALPTDITVASANIVNGTIVDADVHTSAAIAGSKLQASSGSNAGSMSAANFTKLDGIETAATADQTNAEIRSAVEAASDSNVFTDADHAKLNGIETAATADQTNAEIRSAVEAASDSNVFTDADHTKLNGIATSANNYSISSDLLDEDDLATDSATKVPSQQSVKAYISNNSQPKDNELTTLAGMQAGTASILASGTALTSTTAELNLLDGKSVVTTVSGSSTDVQLPTAKAVNDQIANLLNEVGGFVPIADDQSFPNANPDPGDNAGTIVSIADAGGLVVNSSGVTTTGRTLGGATVTINGIDTALRGTTIAAGKGMLVQTTTTLNTYDYHRLVVDEAGVASAQTLVSDFNDRYQVAGSAPSTHPDGSALTDGDLWFDTASNTMKVYDLGNTSYAAVTSVGDYKLLTIVNDGQTSGSPTYNGSNVSFDLRDGSNAASITSVGQLLISVNGVLQKPNSGSWSASNEGFHLEGTNGIKFCTAPASGDSIFITLIGSATSVNVPATNSIVEAAIQDNQVSEGKLKISNAGSNGYFLQKQSGDTGGLTWAAAGGAASIADDSIVEAKLDIHAAPSGTNKFLGYTSNGMEWAVPPDTNTQVGGATGVDFNDNVKTRFGTGNDLQIYHDATNSEIKESTGNLNIICNSAQAINLKHGSENMLRAITDGAVELYHDDTKKFETSSTGVTVNGKAVVGGNLELNSDAYLKIGAASDLQLFHNGSHSYLDFITGNLNIRDLNGNSATFAQDGAVELYYDNVKKFETTNTGAKLSGNLQLDLGSGNDAYIYNSSAGGLVFQADENGHIFQTYASSAWNTRLTITDGGNVQVPDNGKFVAGAGDDLQIYHDGTNSVIDNNTGYLKITGSSNDVYLQSDSDVWITSNNAGETMAKFTKDGAAELYYDDAKKFETTSTGVTVTGACTATSFSGDGSSLTNLPASGGSVDLTANGAIAANKPVIVNSSGQAEEVAIGSDAAGSAAEFSTDNSNGARTIANPNEPGKFVVISTEGSTLKLKVASVSGTTISYGTAVSINTVVTCGWGDFDGTYVAKKDCYLLVHKSTDDYYYVTCFTVSGTSITLSTKSLAIDSSAGSDISIAPSDYDDGWCSLMWYRNYQTRWYIRGVKPNSTLTDAPVLSSGSQYIHGYTSLGKFAVAYNKDQEYFYGVFNTDGGFHAEAWTQSSSTGGCSRVGVQDDITDSFNSTGDASIAYDESIKKVVVAYRNGNNGKLRIINYTGSAWESFSTYSEHTWGSSYSPADIQMEYHPGAQKLLISYKNSSNEAKLRQVTSAANLSFSNGTNTTIDSDSIFKPNLAVNSDGACISYSNNTSNYAESIVYKIGQTNMTTENFVGFASAAINSGSSGTINIVGNTSTQSSLTPGKKYYVQAAGTLSTTPDTVTVAGVVLNVQAGLALSSTKLLIK